MNRIYLDHSATSPLRPEAREAMLRRLEEPAANPSSVHRPGHHARMTVERAREQVAGLIGAQPDEIVFTGGGSEANNLALFGGALSASPDAGDLVTTAIEHPSVAAVMEDLEERGYRVRRIVPPRTGQVTASSLREAAAAQCRLVSVTLANHEIGTLQPVGELAEAFQGSGALIHTDAVQAVGKIPVDVRSLRVDLLSIAAHKFGGPQGIGALFVRQGTRLRPHLRGGGQELNRRPGTENVAAIAGFGAAAEATRASLAAEGERVATLGRLLEDSILERVAGASINGAASPRVPGLTSVAIAGATAEALVIALDLEGIAVSAGAACTSGTIRRSETLAAIGLEEAARSSIRISLGPSTRRDEVETFVRRLVGVVSAIRAAAPAELSSSAR